MKRLVLGIALIATTMLPSLALAKSEMYPHTDYAQARHLRFTTPQGKTCADKCRFHINQTHENFGKCMVRHCSASSFEHW